MKFECGDLERALAVSDLMPEAREHLKTCAECRREYRLWTEISASARSLHEEWETPALWPEIRKSLEAERKPANPWWKQPKTWSIAAALLLTASVPLMTRFVSVPRPVTQAPVVATSNKDFLTEQALTEVEKNEAAYRQSIEKLSRIAEPKLASRNSPYAVNTREDLMLLDSAIEETRTNVSFNRFNTRLRLTLADLYREKQQTLKEVVTHDGKN